MPTNTKSLYDFGECAPREERGPEKDHSPKQLQVVTFAMVGVLQLINDPSAGSPTETLLRLLLPLNDRVWITFRPWVVVADLPGPVRKPH